MPNCLKSQKATEKIEKRKESCQLDKSFIYNSDVIKPYIYVTHK